MAQGTVVRDQFSDGKRLVLQLIADGFPVESAAWLKEPDADQWYLYIATPRMTDMSPTAAYRSMHATFHRLAPLWFDVFQVKLVSLDDPVANAVRAFHRKNQMTLDTRYRRPSLGSVPIEEALIYPPPDKIQVDP